MIEIYGQDGCSYCKKARLYAEGWRLPFVYRDITDTTDRAEMFRRNPAARTVPQIFIGDRLIGGFDELVRIPLSQLQQMIGGK